MIWIDIGTPSAEPVTVAEAKAFLRLERDDEDALIATLVAAAREMVEAQTGLILRRSAYRLAFEIAGGRRVELARRPVTAVTAVIGYDAEGVAQSFEPATVAIEQPPFRVVLVVPEALGAVAVNGVEIEIEAGLAAEEVPMTIRLAILRLVAASFELRATVPTERQPAVMPASVRGLLAPFRGLRL